MAYSIPLSQQQINAFTDRIADMSSLEMELEDNLHAAQEFIDAATRVHDFLQELEHDIVSE
jgi:hypothetical protein